MQVDAANREYGEAQKELKGRAHAPTEADRAPNGHPAGWPEKAPAGGREQAPAGDQRHTLRRKRTALHTRRRFACGAAAFPAHLRNSWNSTVRDAPSPPTPSGVPDRLVMYPGFSLDLTGLLPGTHPLQILVIKMISIVIFDAELTRHRFQYQRNYNQTLPQTDTLALLPWVKRQVLCVGDRLKMDKHKTSKL